MTARTSAEMTWRRVTKSEPCPICGRDGWCSFGERVIHCMRVESNNGKPVRLASEPQ